MLSLRHKIFALVFFIQLLVIALFIHSFVASFKEEKMNSAFEMNAGAIAELKLAFDSKIKLVIERLKANTFLIESFHLSPKAIVDQLDIDSDTAIEAVFHYERKNDDSVLVPINSASKNKMPDMTAYFLKMYHSSKNSFPRFWSYEQNGNAYTFFAMSVNEHQFFVMLNQSQMFPLAGRKQLSKVVVFGKTGKSVFSNSDLDPNQLKQLFQQPIFKQAEQQHGMIQVAELNVDKKNYLVSTQAQGSGDLVISTMIPSETAFAGVKKVYSDAITLGLISIICSYFLTYFLSASITKPLNYLAQQMQNVSKGKLDLLIEINSSDEIGALALNFKQMTHDLKTSKEQLQNLNRDLESKVDERTKQLQELSIKDPLTGAFNRRYFDQRLPGEISRAQRVHGTVGLLYLDIDHFKKYNDQNGHPEGDQLLITFANRIMTEVRSEDFFFRLGGEEFCIVTVNTDVEGIKILAEKICSLIYTTDFLHGEKQPMERLTCSIGVSAYPLFAADAEELEKSADAALYMAKQNGRNQWNFAEEPTRINEVTNIKKVS